MEQSKPAATIVVVDPDVLVRNSISEYLRECGYRVIEALSAEEVWRVLASEARVDVVFAEVRLPGEMQGFALSKTLRQTHPEVDVILTSGISDAAEKARDLCDEGPIEKPYQPKDIVARIHRLLEHRRNSQKKQS
jgi:DNA-binding NtrC family response regulator